MKSLILKNDGFLREQPDAIALTDLSPFLSYGDIDEPEPGTGQLKIKVALASVNPSDEMFIQGLYGTPRVAGNGAGFEGVGEVVASGGGPIADGLVGQRVGFVATPGKPGTWSEYSIAEAATCIPLVPEISDTDGAAMIVNPLTALAMLDLVNKGNTESFILSAGASQLCKLMIAAAGDSGKRPIAIVRRDEQIAPLLELGAAHVLNSESEGFSAALKDLMRAEKPRIFLDAVANQTSAAIFDSMPNRSRWVIYGKLDRELPTLMQPGQMIFQSKSIEGFWLTRWMTETPMAEKFSVVQAAQMRFASGAWSTDVTAIVPLADAMETLPVELAKPNGKVFIKP